jgi:hypothetical protein
MAALFLLVGRCRRVVLVAGALLMASLIATPVLAADSVDVTESIGAAMPSSCSVVIEAHRTYVKNPKNAEEIRIARSMAREWGCAFSIASVGVKNKVKVIYSMRVVVE